jgi:hypothetical protein
MAALIFLLLNLVASPFKSKSRLEAENAALRHQLAVLQCKMRGRVQFTNSDRLFFIQLYRWFRRFLRLSRSSGRKPWCAGIGLVFTATGVGNLESWEAARKSVRICGH